MKFLKKLVALSLAATLCFMTPNVFAGKHKHAPIKKEQKHCLKKGKAKKEKKELHGHKRSGANLKHNQSSKKKMKKGNRNPIKPGAQYDFLGY